MQNKGANDVIARFRMVCSALLLDVFLVGHIRATSLSDK